jgi:cell division protein ZapA (FtsZ GTPase activity inhibitor)
MLAILMNLLLILTAVMVCIDFVSLGRYTKKLRALQREKAAVDAQITAKMIELLKDRAIN